jgi:hypothetical protein
MAAIVAAAPGTTTVSKTTWDGALMTALDAHALLGPVNAREMPALTRNLLQIVQAASAKKSLAEGHVDTTTFVAA